MKERLTGAIILVALIVLLVPELLRGPVKSAPRTVAALAEEPPLRSYTINLSDDAHQRNTAAQPESATPQPLPSAPQAAAVAATPPETPPASGSPPPAAAQTRAAAVPSAPPEAAAPSPSPGTSDAGGAWMVQLGSFASRSNAERLVHQLKGQGFTASVSQGTSGRHLYRVRAGPVHDRAAAAQLEAKLKAAGHSGSVVAK